MGQRYLKRIWLSFSGRVRKFFISDVIDSIYYIDILASDILKHLSIPPMSQNGERRPSSLEWIYAYANSSSEKRLKNGSLFRSAAVTIGGRIRVVYGLRTRENYRGVGSDSLSWMAGFNRIVYFAALVMLFCFVDDISFLRL